MLSFTLKSALPAIVALVMGGAMLAPEVARADVLLTVESSGSQTITYSREDLAALPRITFSTSTIWTEGVKEFSGVPMKALLEASGITSGTVRAVAINDYMVEIPVEALEDDAPIIVDMIDGKEFSRREKGPLWILYPFDQSVSYRTEENFGRSVWQLVRLTQK